VKTRRHGSDEDYNLLKSEPKRRKLDENPQWVWKKVWKAAAMRLTSSA
jgi:hypothetical protein